MLCFAFLAIIVGVLSIFAKDVMWDLTHFNNQIEGVASERTEVWDAGTTVSGIVMLIVGGFLLIGSFLGGEPTPDLRYPGSVRYEYGSDTIIDQFIDHVEDGNESRRNETVYYRVLGTRSNSPTIDQIASYYFRELDGQCSGLAPKFSATITSIICRDTAFGTVEVNLYERTTREILISYPARLGQ